MTDTQNHSSEEWRRRERALTAGVVVSSFILFGILVFKPDELAAWLASTDPPIVAGTVLICVGLCSGVALTAFEAVDRWVGSDQAELTEVPWDE